MTAYLDNSATTKPCDACIDAINKALTEAWGNPSSLHKLGIDAAKSIILARAEIAQTLGADKDEIIFTSGGTEANNLAIFGGVKARKRNGNKIVTTAIEHESVIQSMEELEKQGYQVEYLKPDSFGNITKEQISNAIDDKTILVSIMYINNEIGSIMPVKEIKRAVKRKCPKALIHIDCVQAYGKIPINVKKLGANLVTVSAHKIFGPKGIGALYINKSCNLNNQNFSRTFGGEQEKKLRPGTEAAPLICGFSAAAKYTFSSNDSLKIKELNSYTRDKLSEIDGIIINSDKNASDYIINFYVPTFMRSQTILQELSSNYDVYVSNGSACAKGKRSHVLSSMNLSDEIIDKSIRVSFSSQSTKAEVDALITALKELIKKHPRS